MSLTEHLSESSWHPEFVTTGIYSVEPETASIIGRNDEIAPIQQHRRRLSFTRPFWARGVQRLDIAVFGSVIERTGVRSLGYFVTSQVQNQGILTPAEAVTAHPERFLTVDLAKRLATVSNEELIGNFSSDDGAIESLLDYAAQQYPQIRGFSK